MSSNAVLIIYRYAYGYVDALIQVDKGITTVGILFLYVTGYESWYNKTIDDVRCMGVDTLQLWVEDRTWKCFR